MGEERGREGVERGVGGLELRQFLLHSQNTQVVKSAGSAQIPKWWVESGYRKWNRGGPRK